MTYQTERDKLSRHSLNIVELDVDTTISEGGTEYLCDGHVPHGQNFWPCVQSIQWIPTRAAKHGGLGYLGDVVINCVDFPWPNGVGSYFGRLIGSNPYYLNRILKIHVGFLKDGDTFDFANFKERRYLIKKIVGPDQNHKVRIEASDILSQLKESELPVATNGNLASSITSTTGGVVNIGDNTEFSSGGYAIIDDEIVSFGSKSGSDSLDITARGLAGTEATDHDADAPVREVIRYSGNIVDTIRAIIEFKTNIDASYIPDSEWDTERDTYLASDNVEVWLTEPESVDKIIDKLGKETMVNVWWDDEAQEIKLKAIGPSLSSNVAWNDDEHILNTRVTIKRDQRDIITAAWVYFEKINQAEDDKAENFKNTYIQVDTAAESGLGDSKVKKIYAGDVTASATASKVANRIISQSSNPIELTIQVDAKDSDLLVGDVVDITTDLIQGANGIPETIKMRVIERAQASDNRYTYKLVFSGVELGSRYAVIAPNSILSYTSESEANRDKYGFICDTDNEMSNGDDPYLIL